MPLPRRQIAVIGAGACGPELYELARRAGSAIAARGGVLVTGGGGGVMEAASEGARSAGGRTVGVLPGPPDTCEPNRHVEIAVHTDFGQGRNLVVVLSAGAVIAIGGSWGTLSEIAFAVRHGIPVVRLQSWQLQPPDGRPEPLLLEATTPEEAVEIAWARLEFDA